MSRYQEGSIRPIRRAEGMTWVLRYYKTRADGKRVEHTVTIGLVKDIGPKKADASREADRQKLRETNPMNWVSQRTTSDYTAIPMTPKQAFEVLLNIPEPRRTLTLSDAATALCEGCAFDDLKSQLRRFSLEGVDLLLAVLGLVHFRPLVDVFHPVP